MTQIDITTTEFSAITNYLAHSQSNSLKAQVLQRLLDHDGEDDGLVSVGTAHLRQAAAFVFAEAVSDPDLRGLCECLRAYPQLSSDW